MKCMSNTHIAITNPWIIAKAIVMTSSSHGRAASLAARRKSGNTTLRYRDMTTIHDVLMSGTKISNIASSQYVTPIFRINTVSPTTDKIVRTALKK